LLDEAARMIVSATVYYGTLVARSDQFDKLFEAGDFVIN